MPPKKSRTPPPPKTTQGPRRRVSSAGWSGRRIAVVAGLVLIPLALVGVGVGLATRGGGSGPQEDKLATKLAATGCTIKTYPDQGREHVQSLDAKVTYNSFPPTSGSHYLQPAVWGSYTEPLILEQEVHNLEHGGVIIQYGTKVPATTVERLNGFYSSSPNAMLLAPLPKLGGKIAMSAWTHLATCGRFDEGAFSAFRDAFRGKGPEGFPVGGLLPGT